MPRVRTFVFSSSKNCSFNKYSVKIRSDISPIVRYSRWRINELDRHSFVPYKRRLAIKRYTYRTYRLTILYDRGTTNAKLCHVTRRTWICGAEKTPIRDMWIRKTVYHIELNNSTIKHKYLLEIFRNVTFPINIRRSKKKLLQRYCDTNAAT